jgi:hypothetical protein
MILGGITVDWDSSPRIIMVESPTTSILVQDLVDTLGELQAEQVNMVYPPLFVATGKDALGGDAYTGITMTLQNAQIGFESPVSGNIVCTIGGGNLVAVDVNGNFMDELYYTNAVNIRNQLSTSPALIETVVDEGGGGGSEDIGVIG